MDVRQAWWDAMVKRQLHVEGGGDSRNSFLASECRKAFSMLFEKAGVTSRPRVIVCGGRASAYASFCAALKSGGTEDWLLVDAEDVVPSGPPFDPWAHVWERVGDGWARPNGASDAQLQLMAVCTETWLVADPAALKQVFGPKLDVTKLPPPTLRLSWSTSRESCSPSRRRRSPRRPPTTKETSSSKCSRWCLRVRSA